MTQETEIPYTSSIKVQGFLFQKLRVAPSQKLLKTQTRSLPDQQVQTQLLLTIWMVDRGKPHFSSPITLTKITPPFRTTSQTKFSSSEEILLIRWETITPIIIIFQLTWAPPPIQPLIHTRTQWRQALPMIINFHTILPLQWIQPRTCSASPIGQAAISLRTYTRHPPLLQELFPIFLQWISKLPSTSLQTYSKNKTLT